MARAFCIGDRVIVRPYTQMLHTPAPGGAGVVTAVHGLDAGYHVRLDTGQHRDPPAGLMRRESDEDRYINNALTDEERIPD